MPGKRSRKKNVPSVNATTAGVHNSDRNWPDTNGQERQTKKRDTDVEYNARVSQAILSAENYVDSTLAQPRLDAAEYYAGAPLGDEEEGRSQVVLTEVRDTILSILPSLLRIFCSGQRVVQFQETRPDAEADADEATDTCNYVFYEQNRGFIVLHNAWKDALTKRLGVVTWWPEEEGRISYKKFSGLSPEEAIYFFESNPDAVLIQDSVETGKEVDENGQPLVTFTAKITVKGKKYRVRAVPPEEFFIDPLATGPEDALVVGTRQLVTVSDLVEKGYDYGEILENGNPGATETADWSQERAQRTRGYDWTDRAIDDALRLVKYVVAYVRVDKDGDGIAELRKIEAIGNSYHILKDEPTDGVPFATFCPDPEPHTVVGWSIADATMDLQRIKSHVMRDTLDSLKQSIFPRTWLVEGQVNIDDALNKEVGAVIRTKAAGMIGDLVTPFVGQQSLPILDVVDQIKAQRTGVTPASQGLDADLLQSTTKSAVSAQISAAQERIEMIARIFAETGMVQLFKGLFQMIRQHQDKPFLLKLNGQMKSVEPQTWDADLDCIPNVGLGRGDDQTQLQYLTAVEARQKEILMTMGPANPFVGFDQYSNTLNDITQKAGFKNSARYWKTVSPEEAMTMAQNVINAPKDPSPEEMLARVEVMKALANGYAQVAKIAQDRAKLELDADFQRDQLEATSILKAFELLAKGVEVPIEEIITMITRPRPDVSEKIEVVTARDKNTGTLLLSQMADLLGPDAKKQPDQPPGSGMDDGSGKPGSAAPQPSGPPITSQSPTQVLASKGN